MGPRTVTLLRSGFAAFAATVMLAPATEARERPQFKEGEVIVKFAPGRRLGAMSATATAVHSQAAVVRTMAAVGRPQIALVRFPNDVPVASVVGRFRAQPGVEYAEPNYIAYIPEVDMAQSQEPAPRQGVRTKEGRSTGDPTEAVNPIQGALTDPVKSQFLNINNDSLRYLQYGWNWIGASIVWPDLVANPTIAVLDTGVDSLHPDLVGRVVKGGDWVNNDVDPADDNGHGTHVAGIAAAVTNNAKGVAGVSKALIYAVKVLGAQGSGTYFDIAQGIFQAANNPAVRILNMSLGGPCGSLTLTSFMDYAATKGKLIVVAMGNSNQNVTDSNNPLVGVCPASYADSAFDATTAPVTMAIGASGVPHFYGTCPGPDCYFYYDYSCKAPYSNYATWMTAIAPGTSIFSTTPNNREFWLNTYGGVPGGYAFLNGTSMASPMAAGSAARTFSAMPPGTTAAQVKARLTGTGSPDVLFGQGYFIDTDADGSTETECWPTAAGFSTNTNAVHVAAAMKRAEADGVALDANGALGLTGAKVTALSGAAAKGVPGMVDLFGYGYYRVLNIPMNNSTPYDFAVSKAGYTAGNQKFTRYTLSDCGGGTFTSFCAYNYNEQISAGFNTSTRYNLVTDWSYAAKEIDQYLYSPSTSPTACSVGFYGSCGAGELNVSPYMKWLHDGGPFAGSGAVELTQIQTPLLAQGAGTPYEVFAWDYCLAFPGRPCGANMYDYDATFRLWKGGVILSTVRAGAGDTITHNCTLSGGAVPCDAWYIGDLSSTGVFTARNRFGTFASPATDPDGVLPYRWRPTERTNDGTRGPGLPPRPKGVRAQQLPE